MADTATAYDFEPAPAPVDPATATLGDIEHLAKRYATRRAQLRASVDALESDIRQAKRRHLPTVQLRVQNAAALRDRLRACIAAHPEYFRDPKTLVLHGVRIGYQKQPDRVEWAADGDVCARIEQHLPEMAPTLINRPAPKPVKRALLRLAELTLTRIGVRKIEGADEVIVKPTDTEVDKLVDKLLETTDEEPRHG